MAALDSLHSMDTQLRERENRKINRGSNKGDGYYSALVLMYLLISMGVVLSLLPLVTAVSSKSKDEYQYTYFVIKIMRNINSCTVTTVQLWMVRKKTKWIHEGAIRYVKSGNRWTVRQRVDNEVVAPEYFNHNYVFRALLVLGVGSMVKMVISIVTSTACLYFNLHHLSGTDVITGINNYAFLAVLLSQLLFFYTYKGIVFTSQTHFHFAMAVCIANNIWGWLGTTFTGPFYELLAGDVQTNHDIAHVYCYFNHSSNPILYNMNEIQRYFSILFPEYCIMAISIFGYFWSTMSTNPNPTENTPDTHSLDHNMNTISEHCRLRSSRNSTDERQMLLSSTDEPWTFEQKNTSFLNLVRQNPISFVVSLTVATIYMAFNVIIFFGGHKTRENNLGMKKSVALSSCLSFVVFLPTICLMTQCLRRLTWTMPFICPLNTTDYLQLFTTSWGLVCDILQIAAALELLRSGNIAIGVIAIVVAFCFTVQNCLQTKLLLTIQRKGVRSIKERNFIRSRLIYLSVANLVNWLLTALTHELTVHEGDKHPSIISLAFDKTSDDSDKSSVGSLVVLTIYPMLSLYRFQSAVICYDLLRTQKPFVYQERSDSAENIENNFELHEIID